MATQKAVTMTALKQAVIVTNRSIPKLRPGYLLVRVSAVALNPTDWKHVDFLAPPGALIGCDYAGVVEETGTGYTKDWKKGDRICGLCHGGDETQLENGAFAEQIVVKADVQMRIPDKMSDEEAATLGIGFMTVGQGLFQALKLPLPTEPAKNPETILIYGGSTATGTLGIQLAKL
jgi:NADPH:quinone reductase-like Zn-dependent oxidoreductase